MSTHCTDFMFDNINNLSDQIDIGILFNFDQKDLVQLIQVVVTAKRDNNELITSDGPSLANNEVLDKTLIYIVMFIS